MNDAKELVFNTVDLLAHEYGWSIEYIQSLEMPEIEKLITAINKRRMSDLLMQSYIINCAFVGKVPDLGFNSSISTDDAQMPEDVQLVKLMNEIGGEIRRI